MQPVRLKHLAEVEEEDPILQVLEVLVEVEELLLLLAVALLLLQQNCTVTIAHSRTKDLAEVCRRADILVAAVGRPRMIKGDWIKPGAVVIDVGINRVEDASAKKGYRLVGDVDFDNVAPKTSLITPVPGGVGPMTRALLLANVVEMAERQAGLPRG